MEAKVIAAGYLGLGLAIMYILLAGTTKKIKVVEVPTEAHRKETKLDFVERSIAS